MRAEDISEIEQILESIGKVELRAKKLHEDNRGNKLIGLAYQCFKDGKSYLNVLYESMMNKNEE